MSSFAKLKVGRAEAEKVLKVQKMRGSDLGDTGLESSALDVAMDGVDAWEHETREILINLFDTEEFANKFSGAAAIYKRGTDLLTKLAYCESRVIYKNYALDEIIKRLPFCDEPNAVEQVPDKYAFWCLIHPEIERISRKRFEAGHQADAVETALKHVNSVVKDIVRKSRATELDGSSLMNTAFSPNNPVITLADLSTDSGKNIQQGYMQIFAGAMTGIRNPKAHGVLEIDDEKAIHLLFLASLLMKKIDERIA